jgi:hypothetical protein
MYRYEINTRHLTAALTIAGLESANIHTDHTAPKRPGLPGLDDDLMNTERLGTFVDAVAEVTGDPEAASWLMVMGEDDGGPGEWLACFPGIGVTTSDAAGS